MKKFFLGIAAMVFVLSGAVSALGECDLSSMTFQELQDLQAELETEMMGRPEWGHEQDSTESEAKGKPKNALSMKVRNYVGLNLISCGYTSMGGDLRDKYGVTSIELIIMTPDGTYVNPENQEQLKQYTVVAQQPAPDSPFDMVIESDGDTINSGYDEIILMVNKNNEKPTARPEMTELSPSPNKEIRFVKDYCGRNLLNAGYTSLGGDRYDEYGPDGYIQLALIDEDGNFVDPDNTEVLQYYIVTDQSVEPNTEVDFTYTTKDGDFSVENQSVNVIQLTVKMTENGKKILEAQKLAKEKMREAGLLFELYNGVYEIGVDLEPGNYRFSPARSYDAVSVFIYPDKEALNAEEGEWLYLYGANDAEYFLMREGMYMVVEGDTLEAQRSEFATEPPAFDLYEGVYKVGVDLQPGDYRMQLISDSCSIRSYKTEEAFRADDSDWEFLYGSGDEKTYRATEGMIFKISDGAVKVTVK